MKKLPVILVSLSLFATTIMPVFAENTVATTGITGTPTTTATSAPTSLRQVVRPTLKAMRAEAMDTMKDSISKAKEVFREKLAIIKDEQKKTSVENIDSRIATVIKIEQPRCQRISRNFLNS
jgi:formate dehydrogenase maturation protein FdhE